MYEVSLQILIQKWPSRKTEPIRALVLNAAWQDANPETMKPRRFTKEAYEGNFGINYLANFLLVLLLLQSIDKKHGRIVIIASWTHDPFDSRNNSTSQYSDEKYKTIFTNTECLAKGV